MKKIGENSWYLGLDKEFLDLRSKVWSIKGKKKDKSDFNKIKNFPLQNTL